MESLPSQSPFLRCIVFYYLLCRLKVVFLSFRDQQPNPEHSPNNPFSPLELAVKAHKILQPIRQNIIAHVLQSLKRYKGVYNADLQKRMNKQSPFSLTFSPQKYIRAFSFSSFMFNKVKQGKISSVVHKVSRKQNAKIPHISLDAKTRGEISNRKMPTASVYVCDPHTSGVLLRT